MEGGQNMNPILQFLANHKLTRYGTLMVSGVIVGLWAGNQWPAENAKLWAMPAVSLAMALAGIWGGKLATAKWNEKVEDAEKRVPPGMTVVEACKGEVVPK
jgi:prolipoprotein diacylglyceryltransferase